MEKKDLKTVSLGLAIANLAVLLVVNYGKVDVWGSSIGFSFFDAKEYAGLLWLLLLIPIALLAVPFMQGEIEKFKPMLSLALPVVGLLLHVILFFYFKGKYSAEFGSLVSIKAGLGFYLVLLIYIAQTVVAVMASKGTDFGNQKLNDLVDKAADTASSTTEKVTKAVNDVKNKE